ncbi:MAG: DUF3052 domain-containing protein [Propionibacteriales bacterium]|nr:DUF3052 domain-containing protein [Propionibacteriales bacterium]
MSATTDGAETGPASRFGFEPGMVVQELGWDEDIDEGLRASIEAIVGAALVDDRYGDVVDAVLLWWRDDDGDLVDGLVDSLTDLAEGGMIWLLTPKVGRANYVDASDIAEAAPTAGLSTTTSLAAGADWSGTKLVSPKSVRPGRR